MLTILASVSYWITTVLWLVILFFYLFRLKKSVAADSTVAVLLIILSIDAFRTLFESAYFGLYFNSLYGLLPGYFHEVLSVPALIIIPKLLNVIAGFLVLFLLLRKWLPMELRERQETLESLNENKYLATKNEATVRAILEGIAEGIVFADLDRKIVSINAGLEEIFGYTIEDLAGKKTSVLYESEEEFQRQGLIRFNLSVEAQREPYEVSYRRKDGRVFIGETLGTSVNDEDGNALGYIGVIRDITARKSIESRLTLAASVFTHAQEGIIITDADGRIIDANKAFTDVTDYERKEVIGQNPRLFKSGVHNGKFYKAMWASINESGSWSGEIWNRRKDGSIYPVMLSISAVYNTDGDLQNYLALFSDISNLKEHEKQLERMAHYDALTGLPNRILLADRLKLAMTQCKRHKQSLAVIFLDLDGFKAINDSRGHAFGDRVLVEISARMKKALREGDTLSRIGGDEFVGVLSDLSSVHDCVPLLERLLSSVSEPLMLDGFKIIVTASIGVSMYPSNFEADADQLVRYADQAMYIAKQNGRNGYHLFNSAQNDAVKQRNEEIDGIRIAIAEQQFELFYQPKVNMKTGTVFGMEALIRWRHPERGLVYPDDFLPMIENHSVSVDLGEWVIETALSQIKKWQAISLNFPVSVNVDAHMLQQKDFAERLAVILAAHPEVNPYYLELEILETSALSNLDQVKSTMESCIALGISFAIDDFGTGYSSLTYLRRLPVRVIKIDQSFVRDMLIDSDDLSIVKGVIGLTASFNLEVIAEGVETVEHGTALLNVGCELAQGYGIARPMPAGGIPEWVAGWQPDASWKENAHRR